MIPFFSKRTDWKLEPNQLSQKLKTLKDRAIDIIDLTESNPAKCGFKYLNPELLTGFNHPKNLTYEPSPHGLLEARTLIQAECFKNKIKPEQIFLTASTSESYSVLMKLLVNPGERILVPKPSYPLFQFLADLNDAQIDPYSLFYEDGWRLDLNSLKSQIKNETKAIILVHPNNPTGSYIKKGELREIIKIAKTNNLAIISDEVFYDFETDAVRKSYRTTSGKETNQAELIALSNETLNFSLGGISKSLGLPQMKLGWIAANGPEKELKEALERIEVIQDTYLSANTPSQNALSFWFQKKEAIQNEIKFRISENERVLKSLSYLKREGGWYGIVKIPAQNEEEFALKLLEKEHVFVHPGYFFDFDKEGYLVLSLIVEPKKFKEGIKKIIKKIEASPAVFR